MQTDHLTATAVDNPSAAQVTEARPSKSEAIIFFCGLFSAVGALFGWEAVVLLALAIGLRMLLGPQSPADKAKWGKRNEWDASMVFFDEKGDIDLSRGIHDDDTAPREAIFDD